MFKLNRFALAGAMFGVLFITGTNALAEEQSPLDETRDLGVPLCKDVMRMSGQDREVSIALAHGYVLGKKGTTKYVIENLAEITDAFIEYCLDHPTANALQSFERIAR
jgi:hypothetical protein